MNNRSVTQGLGLFAALVDRDLNIRFSDAGDPGDQANRPLQEALGLVGGAAGSRVLLVQAPQSADGRRLAAARIKYELGAREQVVRAALEGLPLAHGLAARRRFGEQSFWSVPVLVECTPSFHLREYAVGSAPLLHGPLAPSALSFAFDNDGIQAAKSIRESVITKTEHVMGDCAGHALHDSHDALANFNELLWLLGADPDVIILEMVRP